MTASSLTSTGSASFNFLHGRWEVRNRKLEDPLNPQDSSWTAFDATVETSSVLAGTGNLDRYSAPHFPNRPGLEALTLRLYDEVDDVWRIWWMSTSSGGKIDIPVVGRFNGNHGVFECDDVIGERQTKVLYEWLETDSPTPFWRQSFSFDNGETWHVNWEMRLTRVG